MYQRSGGAAYKADLHTTLLLDNFFHHPHTRFPTIHIAGTNGKGSVSHMLASVLQEAGYKTGLYTSPHLKDFRERIKINGQSVPQKYVIQFVNRYYHLFEKLKPSFFEMTAAMAFLYFAEEKTDLALIETGMGGRLDSTNIITPLCSVITNIGFDHTQFLGNTLAQIAEEKAGIIKEHIPVIIGKTQPETAPVFQRKAKKQHAEIWFADQQFSIDYSMFTPAGNQVFNIHKGRKPFLQHLETDLPGLYQRENMTTLLQTLDVLHTQISLPEEIIRKGLKNVISNTGLQGRWQVLNQHPLIVCDTGHNAEAFTWLVEQIRNTPYINLYIILGFVNDKHYQNILQILPKDAFYFFTRADIPRALSEKRLYEEASAYGLRGYPVSSVREAYKAARNAAGENDFIYVGGSTYIVAEVL